MDDLLPYYEKELALLKRHSREFAEQYPKIAGRLLMAGETVEDPHVERLIQAFALLASRVHKKLDDEYPELTSALFQALYPDYLRPFPSCSIARLGAGAAGAQLTAPVLIPRDTALYSRPIKGTPCKFKTAYDVRLLPLKIADVSYKSLFDAPEGTHIPGRVNAALSITFESLAEQVSLAKMGIGKLRVFLDAEASIAALLREAIFDRNVNVALDLNNGPWRLLPPGLFEPVGFAQEDALFDDDVRSHAAYRLVREYLSFPEKFNFIDIDFERLLRDVPASQRRLEIHILLDTSAAEHKFDRLLEQLNANNLQLFCTPVVNLFKQHAEPIRLNQRQVQYPVIADARRAQAFEVFAVESVALVQENDSQRQIHTVKPFYALKHNQSDAGGRYWHLTRDKRAFLRSPGFEYEIAIVDEYFDPAVDQVNTLSIELTCTNRDVPAQMPIGQNGGDLFLEGGSAVKTIQLIRKPTATFRFDHRGDGSWRLISKLTLNHWSLIEDGGDGLKEVLTLFNLPASPQNRRFVEGIVSVKAKSATTRMPGNPFPTFVKGVEVTVAVKPENFVGTGIWLFAELLSYLYGLFVHVNHFVKVVVVSASTGEVLRTCSPRSGHVALV